MSIYKCTKYKFCAIEGKSCGMGTREKKNSPKYKDEYSQCIQDFTAHLVGIENKSPLTAKEYLYDIKRFLKFMMNRTNLSVDDYTFADEKFFDNVTKSDIIRFLHYLASENVDVKARARKLSTLRTLFKYLNSDNRISANVAADIPRPKIPKTIPKYLELDESRKLLDSIDNEDNAERNRCILTLFLHTGIRLKELISIDINDLKGDSVIINGKGNKQRQVPLNRDCRKVLEDYLLVRNQLITNNYMKMKDEDRNALFLSKRMRRISRRTVQYIVENQLFKCNLDKKNYSTHKLRHTAATLLHKYGKVDIRTLQTLLGHDVINSTEVYTHVGSDEVTHAVETNPLCKQ